MSLINDFVHVGIIANSGVCGFTADYRRLAEHMSLLVAVLTSRLDFFGRRKFNVQVHGGTSISICGALV